MSRDERLRYPNRVSALVLGLAATLAAVGTVAPMNAAAAPTSVMPAPAEVKLQHGRTAIDGQLNVKVTGDADGRVARAVSRLLERWQARTGLTFAHTAQGEFALLPATDTRRAIVSIAVAHPLTADRSEPQLGEDESYHLEVDPPRVRVRAATSDGALRGLATLEQLLQSDDRGWFIPALEIDDRPRFAWRGLLIDVCRHWEPVGVIERNLDAMALVKLNVLHLHLTEDQGFRIESKAVPQLHELGSDGHYFTQAEMRHLIAYAADRGIRVVPEFDMPGHATSWVVAFPELASAPGPYVIERHWGVFNPVLDPTNEATYALLDRFLGDMAALFPDPYLHIGGDENNGVQWNANPRIQAFIREHNLKDNAGLHAYFNRRIRDILRKYGKKMVGWDEVLHPDLPKDSVVQSWRGAAGLADAVRQGYPAILSNGYYIDLCHSAAEHYRNDPLPADTPLTGEEQARVLGGEATMWGEWVDPETIDSRIWPRTAAIAERLWSPREVNDGADLYRRLSVVSARLEEVGARHEANRPQMIRRFAGRSADDNLTRALAILIDAIEPVKDYARNGEQPNASQFTPLTGLPDMARPESDVSRDFDDAVAGCLAAPRSDLTADVRRQLTTWRRACDVIATESAHADPRIREEARPIAAALDEAAALGLEAMDRWQTRNRPDAAWTAQARARLEKLNRPGHGVLLPMTPAVARLVAAAAGEL